MKKKKLKPKMARLSEENKKLIRDDLLAFTLGKAIINLVRKDETNNKT